MSKIKSKGTKIELKMKEELEKNEILYEYQPKIFGKPDFIVPPKVIVFCDSSFWHGRKWRELKERLPNEYWKDHIGKNVKRDRIITAKLRRDGYVVLRFWDTQIQKHPEKVVKKIKKAQAGS